MPRNVRMPLLGAALCAAALVPLAIAVYAIGPFERLDLQLLVHLRTELSTDSSNGFAVIIARLADPIPTFLLLAVIAGLGWMFRRRTEVVAALGVAIGANLTTQVLKLVLAHPRGVGSGIEGLPWSTAFPSGHTTAAASVGACLILVAPARHRLAASIAGVGFALVVGSATVLADWHYPSDVLGGLLVVSSWSFAAVAAMRLWSSSRDRGRSRSFSVSTESPARPPV
jgi:membrane-associated phospholipid phosphatase